MIVTSCTIGQKDLAEVVVFKFLAKKGKGLDISHNGERIFTRYKDVVKG